jgi:hypothetical protein
VSEEEVPVPDRKLQIIQRGDTFTLKSQEEGKQELVIANDGDRGARGVRWWLMPLIFDLAGTLREQGCSDAQIRRAYESLLSGHDTDLTLDLPT